VVWFQHQASLRALVQAAGLIRPARRSSITSETLLFLVKLNDCFGNHGSLVEREIWKNVEESIVLRRMTSKYKQ
jgi:hypothetical protein